MVAACPPAPTCRHLERHRPAFQSPVGQQLLCRPGVRDAVKMRWCLLLLLGAVVVLGVEVEEQEVDTRERAERADLPPPSRPQRRPGSGAGFSSFLSGEPPMSISLQSLPLLLMKFSHSIGMCEAPAVGKCRKTCVKIKNNRGKNRKQCLLNQLVPFDETCVFFA